LACTLIGEESTVDDVGQLPLERPERFHLALALGELAVVVDAARTAAADLGSRGDVVADMRSSSVPRAIGATADRPDTGDDLPRLS
jgi:hypothetical protein